MPGRFDEAGFGVDGKVALIWVERYLEFLGTVSWRILSIDLRSEYPLQLIRSYNCD